MQSLRRGASLRRSASSARLMQDRTLDTSKDAVKLRDQRLKKAIVREPLIVPAAYGLDWAMDCLAVAHNTARIEVQDLYKILGSLSKRRIDLLPRDFVGFYAWFTSFRSYVERIVDAEEEILFKWIESGNSLPDGPASKAARAKIIALVHEKLEKVANMETEFESSVNSAKLDIFFVAFDEFSSGLMEFYRAVEQAVPIFIKKNCNQAQKAGIEGQLIKAISKGQYQVLFTMARGISQPLNIFAKKNMSAMAKMQVSSHRRKWDDRQALVQAFQTLQREYEKTYQAAGRRNNPSLTKSL
mmetsp:Transcript_54702/g.134071  ORF Transcript_54702/g.134071 Transcript_54702/m.134071 type:complete len:299 (-) Transcript_54702:121-1017(-)